MTHIKVHKKVRTSQEYLYGTHRALYASSRLIGSGGFWWRGLPAAELAPLPRSLAPLGSASSGLHRISFFLASSS